MLVKTEVLEKRLGLQPLDWYLANRSLRWIGHVARMGPERLPARLAFGWVDTKRRSGGQAASLKARISLSDEERAAFIDLKDTITSFMSEPTTLYHMQWHRTLHLESDAS